MSNVFVAPPAVRPCDPAGLVDMLREQIVEAYGIHLVRNHDHFHSEGGYTLRWVNEGNILLEKIEKLPEGVVPAAVTADGIVFEYQIPSDLTIQQPSVETLKMVRKKLEQIYSKFGEVAPTSIFSIYMIDGGGMLEERFGEDMMISRPFFGEMPEDAYLSVISPSACNKSCCTAYCNFCKSAYCDSCCRSGY
jgi:hypothetical protein